MAEETIPEITPAGLRDLLATGAQVILLDVRQPHELEVSCLENIVHIPQPLIPARHRELDPESEIVVICRSGNRSGKVTQFLISRGFSRARNLAGGMNAWAEEIDPSMQTY